MSITPPRRRSAAYRLPGVFVLALLGGGGVYTASRAEKTFSERSSTSIAAPAVLRLHSTNSDVHIVRGTGPRVRIEWQADWVGARPSHFLHATGGSVDLGGSCRGGVTQVTGLFAFQSPCEIRYRIEVPPNQAIHLDIDSGDTSLTGLRGDITVSAHSGDIGAQGMLGPTLSLSANSGDISASFARIPRSITATANSGDVSLRVPPAQYHITSSADSGDRSLNGLTDDPASKRTIVVRTHSGDISIGRSGR